MKSRTRGFEKKQSLILMEDAKLGRPHQLSFNEVIEKHTLLWVHKQQLSAERRKPSPGKSKTKWSKLIFCCQRWCVNWRYVERVAWYSAVIFVAILAKSSPVLFVAVFLGVLMEAANDERERVVKLTEEGLLCSVLRNSFHQSSVSRAIFIPTSYSVY